MARIFITGSSDGLGQMAAQLLIDQGHQVVLHARNKERADHANRHVRGAEKVLIGDLSSNEETKMLAEVVNQSGTFDAVIHNAGVYQAPGKLILAINTLAPYMLTCLIKKPKRLVYVSSGMHLQGNVVDMEKLNSDADHTRYADSKLHVMLLSMAVARRWTEVYSNAVDPGWVPTKMGGRNAPDDLRKGYESQVWLAASNEDKAMVTGRYFHHQKQKPYNTQASDVASQEKLLQLCEKITGVPFPE